MTDHVHKKYENTGPLVYFSNRIYTIPVDF